MALGCGSGIELWRFAVPTRRAGACPYRGASLAIDQCMNARQLSAHQLIAPLLSKGGCPVKTISTK